MLLGFCALILNIFISSSVFPEKCGLSPPSACSAGCGFGKHGKRRPLPKEKQASPILQDKKIREAYKNRTTCIFSGEGV
ncbi:hypothetical protein GCWU000341_01213 [Oribacterium sp. oral taxon 078 str. F0262]|nr:hypothetical protein GCWU000341_01213 [Oribacterium sp. oral taxon 078 str. F0262]